MAPKTRKGWMQAVLGTAALALALSVAVDGIAFGQQQDSQQGQASTMIGKYQPQQAFRKAGYQKRMQQKMRQLQQQGQGQGQNRQQRMQKARQAQQQIIQQFRKDVKKVAPKVAKQAQVSALVEGRILYTGKSMATKDVTSAVVKQLQSQAPKAQQGQQGQQGSQQQRRQQQRRQQQQRQQ